MIVSDGLITAEVLVVLSSFVEDGIHVATPFSYDIVYGINLEISRILTVIDH